MASSADPVPVQQTGRYRRITSQPENPYATLIPDQQIAIIPSFELESGVTLTNVPIAYKTYGTLSSQADNAMVICHALTGSADVGDWWGPLLGGPGKAFDMSRFFVVCMNSLGSPYGSASPVTSKDGDSDQEHYGPEFPLTTIRDDVNLFKLLLDDLGVKQIAAVVGGSMGGMLVLEFAYFGKDYVRCIVPIATSARYSAWGISWGEAQRQSIYCDPKYDDGYYTFDDPPSAGLGAARMSALLTYRSRDSFESRFGRNTPDPSRKQNINGTSRRPAAASLTSSMTSEHFSIHNDGNKNAGSPRPHSRLHSTTDLSSSVDSLPGLPPTVMDPQFHGTTPLSTADSTTTTSPSPSASTPAAAATTTPTTTTTTTAATNKKKTPTYFSAQSYLRYQGDKFIKRFDANCYIAITRKLDTHDVSRGRIIPSTSSTSSSSSAAAAASAGLDTPSSTTTTTPQTYNNPVTEALAQITQPTLILGIQTDGLFTFAEQQELAAAIPNAELKVIDSTEGHDAFLLEFEQVNGFVLGFLRRELGDIFGREGVEFERGGGEGGEGVVKTSTFGEAEVDDITAW